MNFSKTENQLFTKRRKPAVRLQRLAGSSLATANVVEQVIAQPVRKRGRPSTGDKAMTAAERKRKSREKKLRETQGVAAQDPSRDIPMSPAVRQHWDEIVGLIEDYRQKCSARLPLSRYIQKLLVNWTEYISSHRRSEARAVDVTEQRILALATFWRLSEPEQITLLNGLLLGRRSRYALGNTPGLQEKLRDHTKYVLWRRQSPVEARQRRESWKERRQWWKQLNVTLRTFGEFMNDLENQAYRAERAIREKGNWGPRQNLQLYIRELLHVRVPQVRPGQVYSSNIELVDAIQNLKNEGNPFSFRTPVHEYEENENDVESYQPETFSPRLGSDTEGDEEGHIADKKNEDSSKENVKLRKAETKSSGDDLWSTDEDPVCLVCGVHKTKHLKKHTRLQIRQLRDWRRKNPTAGLNPRQLLDLYIERWKRFRKASSEEKEWAFIQKPRSEYDWEFLRDHPLADQMFRAFVSDFDARRIQEEPADTLRRLLPQGKLIFVTNA